MSGTRRRQGYFGTDDENFGQTWEDRRVRRLAADFETYAGKAVTQAATLQALACVRRAATKAATLSRLIDEPGTPSSLATWEKVPMSGREAATSPDYHRIVLDLIDAGEYDHARRVAQVASPEYQTDALEAVQASISRDRERQRKVMELVRVGEVAQAKGLATCKRQSVQLECPDEFGAGGCGSTDNYVPITCDSRVCPACMKRKMGQKASQYTSVVEGWKHPAMLRLSLDRRVEPDDVERAVDALRGAFGRLRRRVVPATGDGWEWREWKAALRLRGESDLVRRWQKRYVEQGKGIPMNEVMPSGFYGIDIKQGNDGTLNVHMHVLADVPYLPQTALSALWDDLIDAPVVDIRRVEDGDEEGGLMEVVGYAAKAPEFLSVEDEIAYLTTLKGSNLIQPFGELHGNTPPVSARLLCGSCGCSPAWWHYLGTVGGERNTVEVCTERGDRPPP